MALDLECSSCVCNSSEFVAQLSSEGSRAETRRDERMTKLEKGKGLECASIATLSTSSVVIWVHQPVWL